MNIITSTQLRTKTSDVIATLLAGGTIDLIHRSRVVGEIKPKRYQAKPISAKTIKRIIALAKRLNFPKLTDKQVEVRYRKHLMEKYGTYLS